MTTPAPSGDASPTASGDVSPIVASIAGGDAFTTGELRAALQKIVFLRLAADHGPGFEAGTIVAAQYWGAGKVILTRFPDGATIALVAHQIQGIWIRNASTTAQPPTEPQSAL